MGERLVKLKSEEILLIKRIEDIKENLTKEPSVSRANEMFNDLSSYTRRLIDVRKDIAIEEGALND